MSDTINEAVQQIDNQEALEDSVEDPVEEVKAAPKKKSSPAKKASAKKVPVKVVAKAPAKAPAKTPSKKATPAKAARVPAETQNGVARPAKGTSSGKIWDFADRANKTKAGAVRGNILKQAEEAGINAATAATQFARWRQFNGISGAAK